VKRILIAMALLFGTLSGARADIELLNNHWTEALNIRPAACRDRPWEQNTTALASQTAKGCRIDHPRRRAAWPNPGDGRIACKAIVLRTEELAGAPIFYHDMRTALRVTSPGGPTFEATVEGVIPWQVPPFRKGQKLRLWCDPTSRSSVTLN
jgi:hypothetical protein